MSQDERIGRPELRLASIHQAGHAMVARHFGYTANWWVWESPEEADVWLGRTEVIGAPPAEHQRIIGLAGELAVLLTEDRNSSCAALRKALSELEMTDADRTRSQGFTDDDVAACRELVLANLPAIRSEARERPDVATQVRRQKSRSFYN